ncbi:hypothetical protein BMF94_3860 [Rhodotorula taiwanensis]|uniref:Conserved oligomeric Golgi complex subunit 7 n=1 Tax=Rhodotorula taiwanensis TaxID=741276 RepID=A0A2S5B8B7_9BASI|nr:hypothetical protein BMF94_3860 [Rhodotorula taiwanensis]
MNGIGQEQSEGLLAPLKTGAQLPVPSSSSPLASTSTTPTTTTVAPELEVAALAGDEFTSEADWLNAVIAASLGTDTVEEAPLAQVEASLTRTLHTLDASVADTSALVDRLITDISLSVPRLTFDLQLMRENALLLRFTLDGIRKRGGGFGTESEVGQVLERMRTLDLVKERMEAARDVLREAESWSTLESEVTGLVGEEQYIKAAERLAEAARSMVVFQNTAEYEARRALMVSLQNQLETSLSAGLVKAITDRDIKACKQFFGIFGMIQREQEFRVYYFSNRRRSLVDGWSAAKLSDCLELPQTLPTTGDGATMGPSMRLAAYLGSFYSDLQALLNEERTYVPAIFPDPKDTLSSFVETTLEGLNPSLPQRLTAIADYYGPIVLPELIAAFKATEEFAVQVERTFNKLDPPASAQTPAMTPASPAGPARGTFSNNGSTPAPAPSTPTKRRMSTRRTSSKKLSSRSISYAAGHGPDLSSEHGDDLADDVDAQIRPWETALFEPFLDWQVEYPELERRHTSSELVRALGDAGEWVAALAAGSSATGSEQGAKLLLDKSTKVFSVLEEAVGRNLALTHGYAARGLVDVLNDQLVNFFDQRKEDLVRAARSKGSAAARRKAQTTSAALANGLGDADDEQEMVLEGLEYSTEDWSTFQFGLKLLDACRGMADRLTSFESRLKSRMMALAQTLRDARLDPRYTIPGTTRGGILLLRQSTLNSAEMSELFTPFEKAIDNAAASHAAPLSMPLPFLLPKARGAAVDFTRNAQLFVHDTILAPLLSHLDEYAGLSCWSSAQDARSAGKGAFDLAIPTFSLSPTETISRVGEGLFNLPRLFEVYADDDALAFSIETLPFVDAEALRAMQQPPAAPSMTRQNSGHRSSPSDLLQQHNGLPLSSPGGQRTRRSSLAGSTQPHSQPAPVKLTAETVIATWLSSLTLSILTHLTSTILPNISRLSKHGANQLVSDLDYISNVARALDVESPEELEGWRDAAAMDEKALRGETETEARIDRSILERVARIRGLRRVVS